MSLFKIFSGLNSVRKIVYLGNFRWRQDLPAVVQTPASCQRVMQSSQSSPSFQTWFSFCSTDSLQSFSFGPRDQEVLYFLIHLVRHTKVMLAIGIFLFSAVFIACFNTTCTMPTKSLAKYDLVLQLGPFFFPNRSGIKVFGSTNRICDLFFPLRRNCQSRVSAGESSRSSTVARMNLNQRAR